MMAYCTLKCDKCEVYITTKNIDEKLKAEVAVKWGMKPKIFPHAMMSNGQNISNSEKAQKNSESNLRCNFPE